MGSHVQELNKGWNGFKGRAIKGLEENDKLVLFLLGELEKNNSHIPLHESYEAITEIADYISDSPFLTLKEFNESMNRLYSSGYISLELFEECRRLGSRHLH
jgi:hypothetical protein